MRQTRTVIRIWSTLSFIKVGVNLYRETRAEVLHICFERVWRSRGSLFLYTKKKVTYSIISLSLLTLIIWTYYANVALFNVVEVVVVATYEMEVQLDRMTFTTKICHAITKDFVMLPNCSSGFDMVTTTTATTIP